MPGFESGGEPAGLWEASPEICVRVELVLAPLNQGVVSLSN